jgi:hypothetical protein
MSADDHGDYSTYVNYHCRCEACKLANRDTMRKQRERRASRGVPISTPHGRESTYSNWCCRCGACRQAHTAYCAAKKSRKAVT